MADRSRIAEIRTAPMRLAAGALALVAWCGLALQFDASLGRVHTPIATVWVLARYFTVLSNLWLAAQFTGVALAPGRFFAPRALAALAMTLTLVGVVYGLLLGGSGALTGGDVAASILLHKVTPLGAVLFWSLFVPKGRVRPRDPLLWLILPSAYLAYALTRGAMGDVYAYPFLDIGRWGAGRVALNAAAIGGAYLLCSYAFAAVDRRLGRRVNRRG